MNIRKAVLTAIMVAFWPVVVTAQALPIDPATGQPFPDLTANCPNQVASGTTLNVTSAYDQSCLGVHGTLNITALPGQTLTFKFGTVQGYPGCSIYVNATASGSKVDLVGKDIAATDQFQYGGPAWLVIGCTVRMNGRVKSPFSRLTAEPQAGQTTLSLASTTGAEVGDRYVVPDTVEPDEGYVPVPELFTATAIGANVALDHPITKEHPGARDASGAIEVLPHAGNLTRSIRFRAENPNGWRPHMLLTDMTDSIIEYVEFTDCGRTTLDSSSQKGRYCLHHHHQHGPFRDTGVSVWNTPKWGPTIHHSNNGIVEDSICYNGGGACFMTEDNTETANIFRRNLAVKSTGGGRADGARGTSNACFWAEGPSNLYISNYAYNCLQGYAVFGYNAALGLKPAMAQFDDNEAWANYTSLELWDVVGGKIGQESVLNRFKSYNNQQGLFMYSIWGVTFNDFVDRGDPRKPHNLHYLALNWAGDYMTIGWTFNRPNIQNRYYGVRAEYGVALVGTNVDNGIPSTTVRDGYFCNNVSDIEFRQVPGSSQNNYQHVLTAINNRHCASSQTHIGFTALEPYQTQPVTVTVQSYQGVAGDDFQLYTNATAPANATVRPNLLDKVVGGLPPSPDSDGDGFPDSSDLCPSVPGVSPDGCPAQTGGAPTTSTISVISGPTAIQNGQQLWKLESVEGPAGTWQTALWGTDTFRFNVTVVPGAGALPVVLMLHGAGGPNGPKEPQEFIDTTTPGIYINPVSIWYVNGGIDPLTGTSRGEDWWMGYADANGIFQPVTADRVVRYVQWVLTQTAKWTPDPNRVYVQGGSMGGGGAQKIGLLNPNLFAAVVGVTGWIDLDAWVNGSYCKPGMAWRISTGPLCTDMHDSVYLVANATGRKIPLFLTWGSNDTLINPIRYPELIAMIEARQHPYAAQWDATGHGYFQIAGDPHLAQRLDVAPNVVAPSGDDPATTATGSRHNIGTGGGGGTGPQIAIQAPASVQQPDSVPFTSTCDTCVNMTLFVDGQDTGQFQNSAPWNWTFNSASYTVGAHVLRVNGRDAANQTGFAEATMTVTSQAADTTKPTVSLTAPPSPLMGTVTLTATCTDDVGCVTVQLIVDGSNYGNPDNTAPYSFAVDTTTLANTSHTFSVVGTDAAGNAGLLVTPITRTVDNSQPDPCIATPLTVAVSSWPNPNPGSRQLRYTAPQTIVSFTLDLNLTRAVFRDSRGCQATVIK